MFRKLPILILIFALTSFLLSDHHQKVKAQSVCGDTYTILPGDTLSEIAERCETTVVAILEANPEIKSPTQIYVGQVIRIPRSGVHPILAITPTCGPPGTKLLVLGSGFPATKTIRLSIATKDHYPTFVADVLSDIYGRIETQLFIPNNANPTNPWWFVADVVSEGVSFRATSNTFTVVGPLLDPNGTLNYTVQTGDTLAEIAVRFNRSLQAIYSANPSIQETNQLIPGQVLRIPPTASGAPQVVLQPNCGPAETHLQANGFGFPVNQTANFFIGEYLTQYKYADSSSVNASGNTSASVSIPTEAERGEFWVVVARTAPRPEQSAISNIFLVTEPPDPSEPSIYIVEPGDTLYEIATKFIRTPAAILAANPQIANQNQVPFGTKLIIPGIEETLQIFPASGNPGTVVQVIGAGFQRNSNVSLGIRQGSAGYNIVTTVLTNDRGNFSTRVSIPDTAKPGERWVVVSVTYPKEGPKVVAISNVFMVTKPKPPLEPILTIWPLTGPPGTLLTIVGGNLPSFTQITISVGPENAEPILISTNWTEINGTFASNVMIPKNATPGENWVVSVQAASNPPIQTNSTLFTITGATPTPGVPTPNPE